MGDEVDVFMKMNKSVASKFKAIARRASSSNGTYESIGKIRLIFAETSAALTLPPSLSNQIQ